MCSLPPCPRQAAHQAELVSLRTRLNSRLSKANAFARFCDRSLSQRDEAMARIHGELSLCRADLEALAELATEATDASQQPAILERVQALQARYDTALELADAQRVRPVEVQWTGMASDVRVMGAFDEWTRGQSLAPEQAGTWTTWRGTLYLLPGVYEIKFLVDSDSWRLAPDWPFVGEGETANNILVV